MCKNVNNAPSEVDNQSGLAIWLHSLIFLVACSLVVTRRPDAFFNPQFFVEDGKIWYGQAYNFGWVHALAQPYAGYFQTLPRLAASLALLFPFRLAPLLMNTAGICLQALPVNILLSNRCAKLAELPDRIIYAAVYLALPNTAGINATITNAQWHLALVACLVVLGRPASTIAGRIFEIVIVSLSALTGPFCFLLLAIGFVFWARRRSSPHISILAILAAGSLLQSVAIFATSGFIRGSGQLGSSVESFVRILAGQVCLGALLGHNSLAYTGHNTFLISVALLGTVALIYCWTSAGLELRLFLMFCVLLFMASLASPLVPADPTRWDTLKLSANAQYWFFPMLGFGWSLIWCFRHTKSRLIQILATTMLFFMCIGIIRDWRFPPLPDLRFADYARTFEHARAGVIVSVPVNPVGGPVDWTMHLKKR